MLDQFGKTELEALVASEGGPHVSIYMPSHLNPMEAVQDPLRLKNLTHDAEKQLIEHWMTKSEARDLLAPAFSLVHNEPFWLQRQDGLAIFASQNDFRVYRLGIPFEERLSISRSYLVRPIVPVLESNVHGYVLAVSEHKVNLYEVSEHTIHPLSVAEMPENLDKVLNYTCVDRGQQAHSGASTREGKRAQVFHGQGGKPDSMKEDLRHFFRAIDGAITARLGDSDEPLILACVDSSAPLYREVQSYTGLLAEHISGNVDYLGTTELHQKALAILQAAPMQRRADFVHKIHEHLDTRVASDKISEVIRGSYQGRIQVLFFDKRTVIEGRFDPILQLPVAVPDDAKVELSPYNTDLVECAVEQTIRHRGEVYAVSQVDMPSDSPLAALFRY